MVQEIQWLHGNEVVETAPPSEGHSIYSISNDDLTLAMSGEYFCRAKRTDDTLTDQVSAGTLTVLGGGEAPVIITNCPSFPREWSDSGTESSVCGAGDQG